MRVAAATLALLAACSPFSPSGSESEPEPAPGGVADAAPSPSDGAAPPITAVDAGSDAEAGSPSGCAKYPGATYCNDFDSSGDLTRWTTQMHAFGSADLVPGSVSPPYAVLFAKQASAGPCDYVRNVQTVKGSPARATLHLQVRPQAANATLVGFLSANVNGSIETFVKLVGDTSVQLFSQRLGQPNTELTSVTIALGRSALGGAWHALKLEVVASGAARIARLSFMGQGLENVLPSNYVIQDPELSIGAHCTAAAESIGYDDVALLFD